MFHTTLGHAVNFCRNPKTVKYGTETISYLAHKIWYLVPNVIEGSSSLDAFKSKIRQWAPDYPCRLCKTYLQHVGFIKNIRELTFLVSFSFSLLTFSKASN